MPNISNFLKKRKGALSAVLIAFVCVIVLIFASRIRIMNQINERRFLNIDQVNEEMPSLAQVLPSHCTEIIVRSNTYRGVTEIVFRADEGAVLCWCKNHNLKLYTVDSRDFESELSGKMHFGEAICVVSALMHTDEDKVRYGFDDYYQVILRYDLKFGVGVLTVYQEREVQKLRVGQRRGRAED